MRYTNTNNSPRISNNNLIFEVGHDSTSTGRIIDTIKFTVDGTDETDFGTANYARFRLGFWNNKSSYDDGDFPDEYIFVTSTSSGVNTIEIDVTNEISDRLNRLCAVLQIRATGDDGDPAHNRYIYDIELINEDGISHKGLESWVPDEA